MAKEETTETTTAEQLEADREHYRVEAERGIAEAKRTTVERSSTASTAAPPTP